MRHRSRMIVGILAALLSSAVAVHAGQSTRRASSIEGRMARPRSVQAAPTPQRAGRAVASRQTAPRVGTQSRQTATRRTMERSQRRVSGRPGIGTRRSGSMSRRRGGFGVGVGIGSRFGGYASYGRYPYRGYGFRYGTRHGVGRYAYGYPYGFGYPYGYGYGYGYGYSPYYYGGHYGYWTPDRYLGALRLQVRPRHAEVLVDGYYAGQVDNFDGAFQRLRLEEGTYEIAIEAPGYAPLVFDVRLLPGQTVRYRGELRRLP